MSESRHSLVTVLVVDDDPAIRRFMVRVLSHAGYQVVEADGARSAKEAVRRASSPIELIVCDIRMPGENGLDLVNDLDVMGLRFPVLYVSGMVESVVVEGIAKCNSLVMLLKPFSPRELLARVSEILASSSRLNSLDPSASGKQQARPTEHRA